MIDPKKLGEWMASRKKQRETGAADLFTGLQTGDVASLSKAITLTESTRAADRQLSRELIAMALPHSGNSVRIGVTGVPGVGKSTFIESFGKTLLQRGRKLAVLAIDPTSERTGGSILGDKTRMQELSTMENVFIRPSASGMTLGGVARMTRETVILCEAAGYDTILIETVGVGQSETMVHSMTDFFLLLLLAGAGDELQGIKRGIMEMADGLVITKSDGENEKRTKLAAREIKNAIHLFPPTESGWIPEVLEASSITGRNVEQVALMIEKFERHTKASGFFAEKRRRQELDWLKDTLRILLAEAFDSDGHVRRIYPEMLRKVENHEISPFEAAEKLMSVFRGSDERA
jgi:LAO/AO transport system kinase